VSFIRNYNDKNTGCAFAGIPAAKCSQQERCLRG